MSQFTVYKNENKSSKKAFPYFIDVQTDLLEPLTSRVVIPLAPAKNVSKDTVKGLCPILEIEQGSYVLMTHQLTSVPVSNLKTEVTSLEKFRNEIISAIDLIITGI